MESLTRSHEMKIMIHYFVYHSKFTSIGVPSDKDWSMFDQGVPWFDQKIKDKTGPTSISLSHRWAQAHR